MKKRLTIEVEQDEEQLLRDFKASCYKKGKSVRIVIIEYIKKFIKGLD